MPNEDIPSQPEELHPDQILAATPRDDWQVKIRDESLQRLLVDDPEISVSSLSEAEKASVDVLIMGREHGSKSEATVIDLAVRYQPSLIIHEVSFMSQHDKEMSDVFMTAKFWETNVVVNIPGKLPVDEIFLDPKENGPIEAEIGPLLAPLREAGASVLVRAMGETDPALHSRGGAELQALVTNTEAASGTDSTEADGLIEEEASKIIARENIMVEDISRIIGNLRHRYSTDIMPKLKVLVMGGAFHQPFIESELKALGLRTASTFALDKQYPLSALYLSLLPADRKLFDAVEAQRNRQEASVSG